MATFRIHIDADNEAFQELDGEPGGRCSNELGRILGRLASDVINGYHGNPGGIVLWDADGKKVGLASWDNYRA